jgi:hypothetical protein
LDTFKATNVSIDAAANRAITKYVGSPEFMRILKAHVSNTADDVTGRYSNACEQSCVNLPIKMDLVKANNSAVKVNVRSDKIQIAFTVCIAKDAWKKTTRVCDVALHFASSFLWSISGSGDFSAMTKPSAIAAFGDDLTFIDPITMNIKFLHMPPVLL